MPNDACYILNSIEAGINFSLNLHILMPSQKMFFFFFIYIFHFNVVETAILYERTGEKIAGTAVAHKTVRKKKKDYTSNKETANFETKAK